MSTVTTATDSRVGRTAPPRKPVKAHETGTRGRWLFNIIGLLLFVVMIFPVYWMIATAFKPAREVISFTPVWFPTNPVLDNFRAAMDDPLFWGSVLHSVIVVVGTVVVSIVVAFLAAVAMARFKFYGRKPLMVMIIMVQMLPLIALIIPLFVFLSRVHLTNSLFGLILTYFAFILPYTVWMLRGFVMAIPRDLEEAAMVDGCSRIGAFLRILVPLVAPGFVATSIYAAIQAWNEYIFAAILMHNENETITVWLANLTTLRGTPYGTLMAASTVIALPIVVFFLAIQHRVAQGLTAGAVKG